MKDHEKYNYDVRMCACGRRTIKKKTSRICMLCARDRAGRSMSAVFDKSPLSPKEKKDLKNGRP